MKKNLPLRSKKSSSLPVPPFPYVILRCGSAVSPFRPMVSSLGFNPANSFGAVNWSKASRGWRGGSCYGCDNFGPISEISAPRYKLSFRLANPTKIRDRL